MAEEQAGPTGPDLTQGISLADLPDGGKLLGHVGEEQVLLARRGADVFAVGAALHPLSRARSPTGWWSTRRSAVPGITPASIFAPARRCVRRRSARSTAGRVEQRDGKVFVREKRARTQPHARCEAPADAGRIVIVGGGAAGFAAAEMLRRQDYQGEHRHAERRRRAAGRPAEPFEGLSRGQRARGLGSASPGRLLRRQPHRPPAQRACRRHRRARARGRARGRRQVRIRPASAGDGRRAGSPVHSGRRAAACPRPALARRLPGDHRAGQDGATRGRARRELHRPRGRGVAARARDRGPCRGAGEAADGARSWGRDMGEFVRALHEEHGVVFHLEDTRRRRRGRKRQADERRGPGCRSGRRGARRAAAGRARRGGGARDRSRRRGGRLSRDQRAGHLRRRRHRPLARSASAARPFGSSIGWSPSVRARPPRSTCSGEREAFDAGALLLEPALRRPDQLCRPCRDDGTRSPSRATSPPRIACCASSRTGARSPSPRSSATSRIWRPRSAWRRSRFSILRGRDWRAPVPGHPGVKFPVVRSFA